MIADLIINEKQIMSMKLPLKFTQSLLIIFMLAGTAKAQEIAINKNLSVTNDSIYQTKGVHNNLPVFYKNIADRLTFPLSWLSGDYDNFKEWRKTARSKVTENLLYNPPAVPFNPVVIGEEDRGSYVAKRIVLNISADSRVLSYLLVPKGEGPFPAMLLLHDHGGKFDIGKEKMVRPFDVSNDVVESSNEWVDENYGGQYIGDELAKKGYVCFITDALNWGDRGGGGYDGQQALSSVLLNLGSSFASVIAFEDMRAAEFLASQTNIDTSKIGAIGWSMGGFRTWQIAAMSKHINAGVAICWMSSVKELVIPDNNIVRGNSAYSMIHPNIFNYLDYPDIASIACPKPMFFINGLQDHLFPISSVENAYEKMHQIWSSQNSEANLYTKLWDAHHTFNLDMQKEAFLWLDKNLHKK